MKEAIQTTEGMQRDEGELADQKEMGKEESECMHVEMLSNNNYALQQYYSIALYEVVIVTIHTAHTNSAI